jgi:hypothetical protein
MPNLTHIMPKPLVVPIFWGHDYVTNPTTAQYLQQMISDLVTGPFMNGLAQYGIQRGSMQAPIIIDDTNPPATIIYYDGNKQLQDDITKQLIKWINAGTVPSPPSPTDINQLYLIIPPSETTPETYNFNAVPPGSDPIGNGIQGWHNEGLTNPGPPPTYYWAIVKTNDCGPPSSGITFVNCFAQKVAHELAEQFSDRNGSFKEIGDPCLNNGDTYRGWAIQQYWSDWDNSCINGDNPVSLKKFLTAIGFDFKNKGLLSLGTPTISIDYIALTMQSH